EVFLTRKERYHDCGASQREPSESEESAAPADEVAQHARNETAAKAAEARSRNIDSSRRRHFRVVASPAVPAHTWPFGDIPIKSAFSTPDILKRPHASRTIHVLPMV